MGVLLEYPSQLLVQGISYRPLVWGPKLLLRTPILKVVYDLVGYWRFGGSWDVVTT